MKEYRLVKIAVYFLSFAGCIWVIHTLLKIRDVKRKGSDLWVKDFSLYLFYSALQDNLFLYLPDLNTKLGKRAPSRQTCYGMFLHTA